MVSNTTLSCQTQQFQLKFKIQFLGGAAHILRAQKPHVARWQSYWAVRIIELFHHPRRFYWTALESNGRKSYVGLKLEKEPVRPAQHRTLSGPATAHAKALRWLSTACSKS